jgi:hypothetical protein
MDVELRPHVGRNCATGAEVTLPQYQVVVDGRRLGFLGWGQGKKICFIERVGPLERVDIENKVAQLLKVTTAGKLHAITSVQAPDVPEHLLQTTTEEVECDDFD